MVPADFINVLEQPPRQLGQLGDVGGDFTPRLFELHHGSFDVLTPWTFEGAKIEARFLRLNACQIHLRRACWALWSYGNRIVSSVYSENVI